MKKVNDKKAKEICNLFPIVKDEVIAFEVGNNIYYDSIIVCLNNYLDEFGVLKCENYFEENSLIMKYLNILDKIQNEFSIYKLKETKNGKITLWSLESNYYALLIYHLNFLKTNWKDTSMYLIPELKILFHIGFDLKILIYYSKNQKKPVELLAYFISEGFDLLE